METIASLDMNKPVPKLPEFRPNLSEAEFEADWVRQFGNFVNAGKTYYYQSPKVSPNAQFSSKGWKLHVQFEKGYEKILARILNDYGQYFKIEGSSGTYFNAKTDSGATVYLGSRENLEKVVALIHEECPMLPSPRNYTETAFGKRVYGGSQSDEPIDRGLAARFDVQKSEFKNKYSEYGFATFLEFRGLPALQKDIGHIRELEDIIAGENTKEKKEEAYQKLKEIFTVTEQEVLKDFGKEFVYGK